MKKIIFNSNENFNCNFFSIRREINEKPEVIDKNTRGPGFNISFKVKFDFDLP